MNYTKKISICMMMKDEEANIERCLKSLKPIIDSGLAELIILDTGSKDNSISIAKKYTEKIYDHPWNNNFSDMRNISISYAKGEWIWIMDADETIENPDHMIQFFKKDLSKYNTISIKMKNYMESEKKGNETKHNICILNRGFRNIENFRYEGAIHEQPQFKKPINFSEIIFGHYGYIWEDEEFKQKKFNRTVGILKQELERDSGNIYYQYQLASSIGVMDIKEGLKDFRKTYNLIQKKPMNKRMTYLYAYGMYARIAYRNKEYKEAIKVCREGLTFTKDYIDLWYILNVSYEELQEYNEVLKTGKEFIRCKERFNETKLSKDPAMAFYHLDDQSQNTILFHLVKAYLEKGNEVKAKNTLKQITVCEFKNYCVVFYLEKTRDKSYLIEYSGEVFSQECLKKHFISQLEKKFTEQPLLTAEEIILYYQDNNLERDEYYHLNILRSAIDKEITLNNEEFHTLLQLDYSELPNYYGDIISYMVKNCVRLELFREIGKAENLVRMNIYSISKNKDFQYELSEYLMNSEVENVYDLKYWHALAKEVLLRENIDEGIYHNLFKLYIEKGKIYIQNIYQPNILNEDHIYDLASDEHRFFLYMMKANAIQDKDKLSYVKCLRRALKALPMKKGIEIMLKEVEEVKEVKKEQTQPQDEMSLLMKQFKDNIRVLIDNKKTVRAEELIKQYEEIVGDDVEILLFKSEITLLKNDSLT